MKNFRRPILILPIVLALIFVPMLTSGYAELSLGQSSTDAHEQSVHYEVAAQRLPWRSDLYEQAGLAAMSATEYSRAIGLFGMAGRQAALSADGRLELGQAYLLTDKPDRAIEVWKALLTDGQAGGAASRSLSGLYHQQGRFGDEEQVLRQWLRVEPDNSEAQYGLGLLLFSQASPEALPLLDAVAARGPASLKSHVQGLHSTLETALAQPDVSQRLVICGRTLAAVGEWPLAEQSFLRALQADKHSAPAWAWLGEARQQTGDGSATQAFDRALALSPSSAEIHAMAGLYWQGQKNWPKAFSEFQTAARLEPQNSVWQMSLGDVSVHLGDLVKGLAYYQAAVNLAPRDAQTWSALALFSVENDVDVEGLGRDAALRAYALQPGSGQVLDILGRTLLATAQWDTAELFFKKAIAAGPNDAAPNFHLGLLYLQTNKPDLARQYLQAAQALDPNGPIGAQAANALVRYLP